MKKELKQYDINNLYKVLRKHDVEILKHYNHDEISDNDYFFYGINSDIVSNTLNILTNYLSGNIESAGVDLSARIILEAMVILRMDGAGAISDNQKKIYRYLYAYVDADNFHSVMKDLPEEFKHENLKKMVEDKEKAKQAMLEHFGCTEKDLKDRKMSIDDPCFYLKSKLREDIRFSKLLKKYPLGDGSEIQSYEFFSMFIHPRCEMHPKVQEDLMRIRKTYIDQVLNYVFEYLKACNLLEYEDDALDFDHEFFYNPLLVNNVSNVKQFEYLIHLIKNQVCDLPSGYDAFTWQFLEKVRYLVIDMMTSLSLGYREHVIAIFKSFLEEYSVFFAIGSVESQKDYDYLKKAYWISSRIQLDAHFQELGIEGSSTSEDDIKDIYENYYKEKYNMNKYESFYWELKRNSLFFLEKDKKSFNKHVRALIEDVFINDEFTSKDVMTLYRISKDMSHASGYNFNATAGMVDACSQKVLIYTYELIIHFVLSSSEVLAEHGIKTDVRIIVDFLKTLISIHSDALDKIYKEHVDFQYKNNPVS